MRAIAALVLLSALAPSTAAARDDVRLGAPAKLRTAAFADLRPQPNAREEKWVIRLFDPSTHRRLTLTSERRSESIVKVLLETPGQDYVDTAIPWDREVGPGLAWGDANNSLALTRDGRHGMTITGRGSSVEGQLRLRGVRHGGYASRWRFGTDFWGQPRDLNWAEPVATGNARGRLVLRDWDEHADVEIRDWRVSIEHWWGYLGEHDRFQSYVLHQPHGAASTLVGALRPDLVFGNGAIDALWFGVLVRSDRDGVRLCRPRVHSTVGGAVLDGVLLTGAIRARCGRHRTTFIAARGESGTATNDGGLRGTGRGVGSSHFEAHGH
jgi:hypothetical protein